MHVLKLYSEMNKLLVYNPADPFDEERHSSARPTTDPETLLLHTDDVTVIERAMSGLPIGFVNCSAS